MGQKQQKQKQNNNKEATITTSTTTTTTKVTPSGNDAEDEKDMLSEYMPLFNKIDEKKKASDARRKRLMAGLLTSGSLKPLTDFNDDLERQAMMQQKLELC